MTTGRRCPPGFYWLPWLQEEDVLQDFTLFRRLLLLIQETAGILSPHDCTWVYKDCFYNTRWWSIKMILSNYIAIKNYYECTCVYKDCFTIPDDELLKIFYKSIKQLLWLDLGVYVAFIIPDNNYWKIFYKSIEQLFWQQHIYLPNLQLMHGCKNLPLNLNNNKFNHKHYHVSYCKKFICGEILT